MKCPFCGEENTKVIDSRPAEDGISVRRRRMCEKCRRRFTTYEKVETVPLLVVKKDNRRELFDREKIQAGVLSACHKRPISADQIVRLVDEVEAAVFSCGDTEVKSSYIGELVMDKLKALDQVAYVRFASVYREFQDAKAFMAELEKLPEEDDNA